MLWNKLIIYLEMGEFSTTCLDLFLFSNFFPCGIFCISVDEDVSYLRLFGLGANDWWEI